LIVPKTLIKYAGIFALCGWMFFIGVLVGRGTAPVKFQTQDFQKKLNKIFVEAEKKESVTEKKPELKFYDALKKPDDKTEFDLEVPEETQLITIDMDSDAKSNKIKSVEDKVTLPLKIKDKTNDTLDDSQDKEEKTQDSKFPLKRSKKAMSLKLVKEKKQANSKNNSSKNTIVTSKSDLISKSDMISKKTVTKSKIKQNTKTSKPLDKSKKEKSNKKLYTIQLAAYSDLKIALKHISDLKLKGYSPYKVSVTINNKLLHRIRIGSFTSVIKAKNFLKKLESEKIKGIVIRK